METLNRSSHSAGALLALSLVALASAAHAVTPAQSPGHQVPTAAATTPNPTPSGAATPKWQSGVGEWVGAPCRLIVQSDDGKHVEADCFTAGGLHHYYKATYVSADQIEGTVTRVDPSGCEVAVPMSVHITDANHFEYTHPGFTGCGVNNAGPANAYPVSRAKPVSTAATTGTANSTGWSNSKGANTSSTNTASTKSAKPTGASTARTPASGSATTPATAAAGAKPATPIVPKKIVVATAPQLKAPVTLPVKTAEPQN